MCGRFTLGRDPRILEQHFEAPIPEIGPRFNIAPMQAILTIRRGESGREAAFAKWGLVPSWARDTQIAASCLNARGDTVASKPAFRSAFRRKRCLIPADGFYEWMTTKQGKQPFRFHLPHDEPFAFAGLWEEWDRGEGPLQTACLITTEPNEVVAPVHNRMPVILSPADYDEWLDPDSDPRGLLELLVPFEEGELIATPASKRVNSVRNEGADLLAGVA